MLAAASAELLAQRRDPGAAPASAQTPNLKPQPAKLQGLARGTMFRDCAGCPDMVVSPAGSVSPAPLSGDTGLTAPDQPPHPISIPAAIGVGKFEVTKAQFAQFVRASDYAASGPCFAWNGTRYEKDASKNWRNPGFAQTGRDPVVCVNWRGAKAYADWLSQKTGKRYRLPTEIEWEYAARG